MRSNRIESAIFSGECFLFGASFGGSFFFERDVPVSGRVSGPSPARGASINNEDTRSLRTSWMTRTK